MAVGDIALDGVQYRLANLPTQMLANQMAPKSSSGESEYTSLSSWSAWIQSDWQGGIGKLDTRSGGNGVLYSGSDTRVPNQVILSPQIRPSDRIGGVGLGAGRFIPDYITGYTETSDTGTYRYAATKFTTPSSFDSYKESVTVGIFASIISDMPLGDRYVGFYVAANTGNAPGAIIADTNEIAVVYTDEIYPQWYTIGLDMTNLATSTSYWLVFYTAIGSTMQVAHSTAPYAESSRLSAAFDSGWVDAVVTFPFFLAFGAVTDESSSLAFGETGTSIFVRYNGSTLHARGNLLYELGASDTWTEVFELTDDKFTSLVPWGTRLWYTTGKGGYGYLSTSFTQTVKAASGGGDIIVKYGGYLWRADHHELYYSSLDNPGTDAGYTGAESWYGPISFGNTETPILALAGLGGLMHVATRSHLLYLAEGDFAKDAFEFGGQDDTNGVGMVEYNGALFVPAAGRLYRYTIDGSWSDVWVNRDDDLPLTRIGRISGLSVMNQWLIAYVTPAQVGWQDGNSIAGTVLAYQGSSWHVLAVMPRDTEYHTPTTVPNLNTFYDREESRLWVPSFTVGPWYLDIDDYAINPYHVTDYAYAYTGWLEWDWFWGGLKENTKDWEGVAVMGENISATSDVQVYYKVEEGDAWTLLGTVTEDGQELVFAEEDEEARAGIAGRKIKLALMLRSFADSSTPRLRAVRIKYHTMVKDWFRWNLQIVVSGGMGGQLNQELMVGTSPYTAAEMKVLLDALSTRDTPFLYTDIDGQSYYVKATEANFKYNKQAWNENLQVKEWDGIYSMTIEMVRHGTVSA